MDEHALTPAGTGELIQVVQLPVIEDRLRSMKDDVDRRVSDALAMVCTDDTLQAVKKERAELNKLFGELETRRKAVRAAVLAPLDRFEATYKECVGGAFRDADAQLKGKIAAVEDGIKAQCEEELRLYFDELCMSHHIDFLLFEQSGVKIGLTEARQKTHRKLKEDLAAFVADVADSVTTISGMEDAGEILVEYKATLDMARAVYVVQTRRRRGEEERESAAKRAEALAREAETVRRVEAAAPPAILEPPAPARAEEKTYTVQFTARGTREQLIRLREFMKSEGIQYE